MKRLTVEGSIDWKIFINFKVELSVLRNYLPSPFIPQSVRGYGMSSIVLTKHKHLRSAGLSSTLGMRPMTAHHQIAVSWSEYGQKMEGQYQVRQDTSSLLQLMMGETLSGGVHHLARIRSKISGNKYAVSLRSIDQQGVSVQVLAKHAERFPMGSLMRNLDTAAAFLEKNRISYAPRYKTMIFEGTESSFSKYSLQPLRVERLHANYWESQAQFPAGSVFFDHALLMKGVTQSFSPRADIIASHPISISDQLLHKLDLSKSSSSEK